METDPQSFKRKYGKISDIRKKRIKYVRNARICVLPMLAGIALLPALSGINTGLPSGILPLLFMSLPMGLSIFFLKKSDKNIFTSKQRMFFRFYKTEIELESFKDIRDPQSKKNAKTSIDELAEYVSSWISNSAPSSLNELPRNISTNLREKMLPIIDEENMQEIDNYRTTLYNFIVKINDKDPSIEDLTFFNNTFKSMVVTRPIISTVTGNIDILGINIKEVFSTYSKLKYILIGLIAYVAIWIYVQNTQSQEIIQSFVNNSAIVGVVLTILAILPFILKQKSNSKTTTDVKESKSSKN